MVQRYCGGVVPDVAGAERDDLDAALRRQIDGTIAGGHPQLRGVPDHAWRCRRPGSSSGAVNQYIVEARAVGAGEEAGAAGDARRHAVSTRPTPSRDRRADRSGDAGCGRAHPRDAGRAAGAVDRLKAGRRSRRARGSDRSNRCFQESRRPWRSCARCRDTVTVHREPAPAPPPHAHCAARRAGAAPVRPDGRLASPSTTS